MPRPLPARLLFVTCGDPDADVASRFGTFADWFATALDGAAQLVCIDARTDTLDPARLDGIDGVIVSGSVHAAYEPHAWIEPLCGLLRAAVLHRDVPVLGVCFGHQVLARALGGEVIRNPRGREIGTVEVRATAPGRSHPLLGVLGERFSAQVTHCDTVSVPPPGALVLAASDRDGCQAFAFERALGVQFHPEITADIIRAYVRSRAAILAREGLDPVSIEAAIHPTDAGRTLLAQFVALSGPRVVRSVAHPIHQEMSRENSLEA